MVTSLFKFKKIKISGDWRARYPLRFLTYPWGTCYSRLGIAGSHWGKACENVHLRKNINFVKFDFR